MKRFLIIALAAAISCAAAARTPELGFNVQGKFKVLQLTDIHLAEGYEDFAASTLERIREDVLEERPDLIAVTGDIISNGGNASHLFKAFLDTIDDLEVPFFIVFGNHDQEQDLSKEQMSAMITSCRNSINVLGQDGILADCRVKVRDRNGKKDALELYLLDSHTSIQDDSPYADMHIRYEWMTASQVEWIRNEFKTSALEHDDIIPSAAFFHIPLPEFLEAWQIRTSEHFTHNNVTGVRGEYGGHSRINAGMFAAMLEGGSIMGVFCGHDHDSDFIVTHMGIALAYGRCTGDEPTYHHLLPGSRIIEFEEGRRAFTTWIREDGGVRRYETRYLDGVLD